MSKTPKTPRTNAHVLDNDACANSPEDSLFVPAELAEQLEIENNNLRATLKTELEANLQLNEILSDHETDLSQPKNDGHTGHPCGDSSIGGSTV